MATLPYESLIGVSYGLLTGFVPALLIGVIAIGADVALDRRLPVVVGIATVPAAIGTGVALGVFDPALAHGPRIALASLVAGLLGVLATSRGNRVATELPRDRTVPIVRGRALSADAIDAVDAAGQVTIRPTGAIREFEGYPPLSPELRTTLEDGAWRFPADLQLAELERRLQGRLRTEYGLSRVEVSIDGRGRATVAAASPAKSVARALSRGTRAVTVPGLLPTGIEPGDRVAIGAGDRTVDGEVLAIDDESDTPEDRGVDVGSTPTRHRVATAGFDGGPGRITVAVETTEAGRLLDGPRRRIAVLPSGTNREFQAAALLEEAGQPVTAVEVADGSPEPAEPLGVRCGERWRFAVDAVPRNADRAFVAGSSSGVRDR